MKDLVYILVIGFSASALWWLFAFEYHRYRVDLLRHRLFSLRDDLFMRAASGEISFDSKAYLMTRNTINGAIRFAHRLSLLRMIIMFFLYKTTASKYLIQKISKEHRQAMSAIDARAREDINNVHMVMHLVMLAHVLKTSLVLGPVFQLLILVVKFCFKNSDKYWRRFISKDRGYWRALDAEVRQVYV